MSEAERLAAYLKSNGNPLQMAAGDMITELLRRIKEIEAQLPKEGEWIEVHDWLHIPQEERGTYRCSACGQVMKYPWNYCPNCGARMRKGGNA